MSNFLEHPVVAEALIRLKDGLSPALTYHSIEHTLDVIKEVVTLALEDSLAERDVELLAVAAAWHDIGFLYAREANEPYAAEALSTHLANDDTYSADEVALLKRMILDTALVREEGIPVQVSTTRLSPYLLDADLANFGRPDFLEKGELQRLETHSEKSSFQQETLLLLTKHSWLTPAAKRKWTLSKGQNLEQLKSLLSRTR